MPWHKPIVRETNAEAVILLHGLWRSIWAMEPMAQYLHQQGYHTINLPYPSFRKPIEDITQMVYETMQLYGGDRKIHFVTHSLGGIITRLLLNEIPNHQTGRVVMLAPPNQGSEIVDWLEHCKPLKATLGPAGAQLGTDQINLPPPPEDTDTAVIMGSKSTLPFFRTFLDEENDGIVSVNRGKVHGMNEFHVLDTDHTFIASDPRVMEMTDYFLREGRTNRHSSTY